ncbi:MAG: response regulator [Polyangia bacterium]
MVADDSPGMTAAIRSFLRRFGWEVLAASDGLTALELVRSAQPAVALIDIGLPQLDGLEVARRIRADGLLCHLVAMSGHGTSADRDRSLQAGFAVHLVKPIPPAVLSAALDRGVGHGGGST